MFLAMPILNGTRFTNWRILSAERFPAAQVPTKSLSSNRMESPSKMSSSPAEFTSWLARAGWGGRLLFGRRKYGSAKRAVRSGGVLLGSLCADATETFHERFAQAWFRVFRKRRRFRIAV